MALNIVFQIKLMQNPISSQGSTKKEENRKEGRVRQNALTLATILEGNVFVVNLTLPFSFFHFYVAM